MSTLKQRIEQVLAETGLAPSALARIAKVKDSAVSQWKSGATKTLRIEPATNIERELGYRSEWLATGRGTPQAQRMSPSGLVAGEPYPSDSTWPARTLPDPAALLPVLPWELIHNMNVPNDRSIIIGLQHRAVPYAGGPSAKLVVVSDPAMAPRFGDGDILQMDPAVRPKPGSIVLVSDRQGRHFVRIYQQRSATHWAAAPVNANFATLDCEADGLTLVAVATHRIEAL